MLKVHPVNGSPNNKNPRAPWKTETLTCLERHEGGVKDDGSFHFG